VGRGRIREIELLQMPRFSFRVLYGQQLPAVGTVIGVELLQGNVGPGDVAVASISGERVELVVKSVALEGGRGAFDRTFSLLVSMQQGES